MSRFKSRILLFSSLILVLVGLRAPISYAAGPWYVATDGSDSNSCTSTDQPCATVNAVLEKGGFVAGDTIKMSSGQFTGTGDDDILSLYKSVAISGNWDSTFTAQNGTTMIYGEQLRRLVNVYPGVTVILSDMRLQEGGAVGNGGGAIYNAGTLTLNRVIFDANVALTPASQGIGGGILNIGSGILTINDSQVNGNVADDGGGGIWNDGTLIINHSQVNHNGAGYDGEDADGGGGGISHVNGSLTLNNSILYFNTLSEFSPGFGPGLRLRADTILNNTTVAESGGGDNNAITVLGDVDVSLNSSTIGSSAGTSLYLFGGTVHLKNTILANSLTEDCHIDPGAVIDSRGYNFVEKVGTCSFGVTDQTGKDPQMDPYGSSDYEQALTTLSPAIDAGNPAGCTDDQNSSLPNDADGTPRLDGNGDTTIRCDVGAAEYDPSTCLNQTPRGTELRYPSNEAQVKKTKVPLVWDSVQCASSYKVQVWSKGPPKKSVYTKSGLTVPTRKTGSLARGLKYLWQVTSCNGDLCAKSLKSKFSIKP